MKQRPTLLLALALLLPGAVRAETVERTFCVFDPVGAVGDFHKVGKDWATAALEWGVRFEVKVLTDEKIAASELSSGRCHAALLTGTRARPFVGFTGTVEAIGGLPSYDHLEDLVKLLASPKAASRQASDGFENVAVFPAGALHLVVHDRAIDKVENLAGKRIATLDYDEASMKVVDLVGGSLVPAEVSTFAGLFRNRSVDVAYAPITALGPLEILRSMDEKGAVFSMPIAQITIQVLVRTDAEWPEGFAAASRRFAASHFDRALATPKRAAAAVPASRWLTPSPADQARYALIFRKARVALREQGVYDKTMLSLMRRIRCKRTPAAAECAEKVE